MRSPAIAIAWELVRRHRWGFAALAGYLFLLGATDLLVLEPGRVAGLEGPEDIGDGVGRFAATVVVPVSLLTYYFLAVFSYGFTGNLAARESGYPARIFALPVSTSALAFWPMLYGSATIAVLLVAAGRLAVWPSGASIPLLWPTLFAVVSLAWVQALVWLPWGLPGLRIAMAALWFVILDAAAAAAVDQRVSEQVIVAALVPQLPLAYLAARAAVARARRGDVPDWRPMLARIGAIASRFALPGGAPHAGARFTSAASAQRWFEWQQHGLALPVWVAMLLPFELVFLFVAGLEGTDLVAYTVCGALLTPPFMAAFAAPRVRRTGGAQDGSGLPPFLATRPLSTVALVAARLRIAALSTLAAWLLVLVALPATLVLSGTWPVVVRWSRELAGVIGMPRTIAVTLIAVALLVAATWRQLVQGLYIGLSGRVWPVRLAASVTMAVLIAAEPIVTWIRESSAARVALWNAIPWALAALVLTKTLIASWIATRLRARGLVPERTLVIGAGAWAMTVLAVHGLFAWVVTGPLLPRYILLLLAILAVPLARVCAAPLALARNRHQ